MPDGGPQFKSEEFRQFVAEWGIKHVMPSPYFPRSNGLAENGVKIMKRLLSKAAQRGEDQYLELLAYRASPLDCGKRPAEMIFSRTLRTRLPSVPENCVRMPTPHTR